MKILIVSENNGAKIITSKVLPRIGDMVDMFYKPSPVVKSVLLYPTDETLAGIITPDCDHCIQAIISVS